MHKATWTTIALLAASTTSATAIGPENVAVLVNRRDGESLAVANHYRIKRAIPDRNFIYLDVAPNRKETTWEDFSKSVYYPAVAALRQRGLEGQIGVLITTPGFPYRIGKNGLSGVCFFGRHEMPIAALGPASFPSANGYFDRCEPFVPVPAGQPRSYLHMHLDAGNLPATMALINRSVLADNSKPKGTVYLLDGEGPRSMRKDSIPLAARLLDCLGVNNVLSATSYLRGRTDVLGMFSGVPKFPVTENRYVKGALGDLLTSVSGQLLDAHNQTRAWDWLKAGCSASYGAVVEPYNYPQKFPIAKLHAFYAMGFTAVESYWMSVVWPQEGLFVGDPLTRPFGSPPKLAIEDMMPESVFGDALTFSALAEAGPNAPGVAAVDMYIDDKPIGQFRRTELPTAIVLRLQINDWSCEEKLPANGNLAEALRNLQAKLATKGFESLAAAGMLAVFLPVEGKPEPTIAASSNHPYVFVQTSAVSKPRGPQVAAKVAWLVQGNPEIGDRLTLELSELAKETLQLEFAVKTPMSAAELALRMTAELAAKLPTGYQFVGEMTPLGGKRVGRMTLQAPAGKLRSVPRVKIAVKATPPSTLALTPADLLQPLVDMSLNAYRVALIRFGIGEDRIRVNANIPTTGIDDGRHELRIVATRGWPSLPESRLIVPFVVRRSNERLQLRPTAPLAGPVLLSEDQRPAIIAQATYDGKDQPGFDFFVNGDKVRVADKATATTLKFDPKRYGVGRHRVTAVARLENDKTQRSDNEIVVEVAPGTASSTTLPK